MEIAQKIKSPNALFTMLPFILFLFFLFRIFYYNLVLLDNQNKNVLSTYSIQKIRKFLFQIYFILFYLKFAGKDEKKNIE